MQCDIRHIFTPDDQFPGKPVAWNTVKPVCSMEFRFQENIGKTVHTTVSQKIMPYYCQFHDFSALMLLAGRASGL